MVRAAEAAGLDAVAITDHVESDKWGNPVADWVDACLHETEAIRGKVKVRLFVGIEASLIDQKGRATVTPQLYRTVDLVLCGIEWGTLGIAQNPPENKVALQRNLVTAYGNLALTHGLTLSLTRSTWGVFKTRCAFQKSLSPPSGKLRLRFAKATKPLN